MLLFGISSLVLALLCPLTVHAQVEPPGFEGSGNPITSRDRIYTGDQASNTITVIDPGENKVLGTIALGDERLGNDLGPQYVDTVNAHGLGYSRDGKYIVSLAVLSNTVTVIRTADNKIVTKSYVDRGPHEAFFAPDNRTIWIGTRGVSSVNIIDAFNGTLLDRLFTAAGPSKVLFSGNGTIAYVNHIFDAIISVINVPSRKVMYNITGLADSFSSDMMISADGQSLWAAHKMTGQVSVIDLAARSVISFLDTGTETNHPNFAVINGTNYGFVTVAALNATKVYRQQKPEDVPVLVKTIPMTGIQPHGLWPSPDNTRMYVVNQHSDTVDVIDTKTLEIINTMNVGQDGQALLYISRVIPENSTDTAANLGTQGLNLRVENRLIPVGHNTTTPVNPYIDTPQALVTVRQTSGLDMFEILGRDLVPNATYTASALCHSCEEEQRTPLVSFNASQTRTGCAFNEQVLAFLKFFDGYRIDSIKVEKDE